jgi:anti-sigma B factor antagonist
MKDNTITITLDTNPSIPNLKIITLTGIIDAFNCRQVDEKVLPFIEQEGSHIVFDLSHINYLSSTGIMCLLKYVVFLNDQRRLLKFVKPPKRVYTILQDAGLSKKFDMYDNIEIAISKLQ